MERRAGDGRMVMMSGKRQGVGFELGRMTPRAHLHTHAAASPSHGGTYLSLCVCMC